MTEKETLRAQLYALAVKPGGEKVLAAGRWWTIAEIASDAMEALDAAHMRWVLADAGWLHARQQLHSLSAVVLKESR